MRLGLSTFHYATARSTFYNKDITVIRRVLVASDSINDPKGAARISKRDWLYKKEINLFQYPAFVLEMCLKCDKWRLKHIEENIWLYYVPHKTLWGPKQNFYSGPQSADLQMNVPSFTVPSVLYILGV